MTDIQSENSSDANGLYFWRRTGKKKKTENMINRRKFNSHNMNYEQVMNKWYR